MNKAIILEKDMNLLKTVLDALKKHNVKNDELEYYQIELGLDKLLIKIISIFLSQFSEKTEIDKFYVLTFHIDSETLTNWKFLKEELESSIKKEEILFLETGMGAAS